MGEGRLEKGKIGHLRQRKRGHREIESLPADGDRAHQQAGDDGEGDAKQQAHGGIGLPDLERVRRDIGRTAEESGVTEGDHAAVAENEVERGGEQAEAHQLHHEHRIEREGRQREKRQACD